MAIYVRKTELDLAKKDGVTFHAKAITDQQLCFLCGEKIAKTAIFWMGCDEPVTVIYLHPPCAISLFRRLAQDMETYFGANDAPASTRASA